MNVCLTDIKIYIESERLGLGLNILRLCNLHETCIKAHPLL